MPNVSAVNHFMHKAHCSSTSPSCLPLSSSPDPVRASAASEPSPAVSYHKHSLLVKTTSFIYQPWTLCIIFNNKARAGNIKHAKKKLSHNY